MTAVQKPTQFFIEAKDLQSPAGGLSTEAMAIKKTAIDNRAKLMKLPGARRIHCQKIDGKLSIVLRVQKGEKLPQKCDFMAYKKGEEGEKLAEYLLGKYPVVVKEAEEPKVPALSGPNNRIRAPSGSCMKAINKKDEKLKAFTVWISDEKAEEEKKKKMAKLTSPKHKIKRHAIKNRGKLMSFPGARRLRCVKMKNEQLAIAIYTKKVKSLPKNLDFMSFKSRKYKSQEINDGQIAEYEMDGYRVIIKNAEHLEGKLDCLKAPSNHIGQVRDKRQKNVFKKDDAKGEKRKSKSFIVWADEPLKKSKDNYKTQEAAYKKLVLEEKAAEDKKVDTPGKKVKKIQIERRAELMRFPGARRLRCTKKDQVAIVIYTVKTSDFPKKVGSLMLKSLESKLGLAEYEIEGQKVIIKKYSSGLKILRTPKRKVRQVVGIKYVRKHKKVELGKKRKSLDTENDKCDQQEKKKAFVPTKELTLE